jgi:hydroxymethylpyrimidine/phosphomethylpyrimidine kinase
MIESSGSCLSALTIGGSDTAGGAAIQVDLKTFQRFDLHAASVITCVTAQNSLVVTHVERFSCSSVGQQNEAVFSDLVIPVLKFGMLYPSEIVDAGEGPGV